MAAKLRESLSLGKRAEQKFDVQRFHVKKLNDAEFKEQHCQVKISKRFAALEKLDANLA
jgi:hypothetical protein